jgi:hypothetical protein
MDVNDKIHAPAALALIIEAEYPSAKSVFAFKTIRSHIRGDYSLNIIIIVIIIFNDCRGLYCCRFRFVCMFLDHQVSRLFLLLIQGVF